MDKQDLTAVIFIIFMGILFVGSIIFSVNGGITLLAILACGLIVGILVLLSIFKLSNLLAGLVLKYKTKFDLNRKKDGKH